MDLQSAYSILEVDKNSSFDEIKKRYRDLVSIWHPDHHINNHRRHELALKKMQEINSAYDFIVSQHPNSTKNRNGTKSIIKVCGNCGTKNRIDIPFDADKVKCGKCGFFIYRKRNDAPQDEWHERKLCGDDNCIGIIGKDGRCKECGKTYEEGLRSTEIEQEAKDRMRKYYDEKQKKSEEKKPTKQLVGVVAFIVFLIAVYYIYQETNKVSKNYANTPPIKAAQPLKVKLKDANSLLFRNCEISQFQSNGETNILTKDLLHSEGIQKTTIKIIQWNLLTLGYAVGNPDGVIGAKTMTALQAFSEDFCLKRTKTLIADIIELSTKHAKIAKKYPEWKYIYKNNILYDWVSNQPAKYNDIDPNDPKYILGLLGFYTFEKDNPPTLPLPENGFVSKAFIEGIAPLGIRTKYEDQNHYIKLIDNSNKEAICSVFVRGGTSVSLDIPLGTYILKSAVGRTWYGDKHLFGPRTAYSKANKLFTFERVGDQIRGYTVELFLQPHGNLKSHEISAFDF